MRRSAPISQVDVESRIIDLLDEMEAETEAFERLSVDHAKKEARYEAEWAKIYLAAEGAIKQRETWADYQTSEMAYDVKIADALVRSKREKLSTIRSALDALRTLNANVRSMVQ